MIFNNAGACAPKENQVARTKKSSTFIRIVTEVKFKDRIELQAIYRKPAPGAPGRRAAIKDGAYHGKGNR